MLRKMALPVLRQLCAFVAVLLTWAASGLTPAHTAELAESAIVGYSVDGRYFAFEEFGIQDGSGFAYSNVFVIDLERDRWVPGTPIRRRGEDETERLFDVRAEAMADAQTHLDRLHISAAYRTLAATTPMEAGDQERHLTFNPRPILTPIDPPLTMRLQRLTMASPRDCFDMVETAGFVLTVQAEGGPERTVHRDERLPYSRACPSDYGIAAIITPFDGAPGRAVAMISVYQLGFEGLDRRFLAVPFDLAF
jgi:predicted secreted protein